MIDSLTMFLVEVGEAGEASEEFMELYQRLLTTGDWKYYLAVRGVPATVAKLITKEIVMFGQLEQTRLSSDLALGYAVKQLTVLLGGLLHHADLLLRRRAESKAEAPVVVLLLRANTSALRLAVRWQCKLLLSQPTVQLFLQHEWRGAALNAIAVTHYKTLQVARELGGFGPRRVLLDRVGLLVEGDRFLIHPLR